MRMKKYLVQEEKNTQHYNVFMQMGEIFFHNINRRRTPINNKHIEHDSTTLPFARRHSL